MSENSSPATQHVWKFFRTGGLNQVSLETADDLLALSELDEKLWVALSCPVKGLELDEQTLALIDTDGDGIPDGLDDSDGDGIPDGVEGSAAAGG